MADEFEKYTEEVQESAENAIVDTAEAAEAEAETVFADPTAVQGKKSKKVLKEVLSWLLVILAALVLGGLIRMFGVMLIQVNQSSMHPTCESGDKVIINKFCYLVGEPQRGDIIVFEKEHGKYGAWFDALPLPDTYNPGVVNYIKRVIGVAGDTVSFDGEGHVLLNGEILDEPYLGDEVRTYAGAAGESITVPEGYIFVMGDNRSVSLDGRSFGCTPVEDVKGKVFFRVTPFDRMGKVE